MFSFAIAVIYCKVSLVPGGPLILINESVLPEAKTKNRKANYLKCFRGNGRHNPAPPFPLIINTFDTGLTQTIMKTLKDEATTIRVYNYYCNYYCCSLLSLGDCTGTHFVFHVKQYPYLVHSVLVFKWRIVLCDGICGGGVIGSAFLNGGRPDRACKTVKEGRSFLCDLRVGHKATELSDCGVCRPCFLDMEAFGRRWVGLITLGKVEADHKGGFAKGSVAWWDLGDHWSCHFYLLLVLVLPLDVVE